MEQNTEIIPKVIHYCWFGGKPLPGFAKKYIKTWKKYLPDYEIKEWNETNFDVNIIPYTREAYKAKKYAFVSDYARFYILYKYGGIYFDTDVEVIKNMDDIIARGPFMGCERKAKPGATPSEIGVAPGLGLGVNPGLGLFKELLEEYANMEFYLADERSADTLKTIVDITSEVLCRHGLKNSPSVQLVAGVYIYPEDYFSPKVEKSFHGYACTPNTVSIHHYAASWKSKEDRRKRAFVKIVGPSITNFLVAIKHRVESIIK